MDVEEYQRLTQKIDRIRTAGDKAAGALEQTLAQIKSEFGVGGIAEAEALIKKMNAELEALNKDYEKQMAELRRNFPQLFKETL